MNRRAFLSTALVAALAASTPTFAQEATVTRWRVLASEGLDAIAFLGALSGTDLYQRYYKDDAAAFGAKLAKPVLADIGALWKEAEAGRFGLLWPSLTAVLSGLDLPTVGAVATVLAEPERLVRPSYEASEYWDETGWAWLTGHAPRLQAVFEAMHDAEFGAFRSERTRGFAERAGEVQRGLAPYDVIKWQRKLTGREFAPTIDIILMYFSKPHGAKLQGQTFLQAADYDVATTVRIAAHEMLHPPIPMGGDVATAVLATLAKDPLIARIVREHDPRWGYTTLEGMLNEDLCQALDQLISEALGVARNPSDRWRKNDDGIHVLAGALYGLLRQDRWVETGGSIEKWLDGAEKSGRFAPPILHSAAADVLERPIDRLWPLSP